MATYTCKRCGKQFELAGFSNYCWDCRHRVTKCVVCGKEIIQTNPNKDVLTCSKKCTGIRRKQSGQGKAIAQKAIQTKLDKYGNAGYAVRKARICKLCGEEFIPNGSCQVICKKDHYGPCPVCGKPTLIYDFKNGPHACSIECRNILSAKTREGKDYSESYAKGRQTTLEKYGVEYYSQTLEWKEKVNATSNAKFGTDWAMQNEEHQQRTKQTNLERYGFENAAQSPEIIERIKQTNKERHGGVGMASAEIREKIYATNKERYGDEHPARTLQCKQKSKQTSLVRYGFESYASTKEHLAELMLDPSKVDQFWEFRLNPQKYVESNYDTKPYVDMLAKDLGVNETSIYDILIKTDCYDAIDRTRTSIIEREVYEFLLTLVPEEEIKRCDRRTITPFELDFYLPKYRFAIECDPTYTHNSSFTAFNEPPKSTVYHRDKTNKAEEAGVFLFHIFGYDWAYKKEIIQSMIRSILGYNTSRIYARNTYVEAIDYKTCQQFLDINHRQGFASSSIRLGLKDKKTNKLISVMTFGKLRSTIGKQKDNAENSFELIRFCNLLNTTVVGGASKLFSYFIKQYNPQLVMSFSDRAHTRGNLYPLLHFHEVKRSEPGYAWVDVNTEQYYNRVQCQKHNLANLFDDVTEQDIAAKSENEIMTAHGYARVFDSGTIRWEFTPAE